MVWYGLVWLLCIVLWLCFVVWCDVLLCVVFYGVMLVLEPKCFHFKVQQLYLSISCFALLLRLFRLKKYGYWIGNAC